MASLFDRFGILFAALIAVFALACGDDAGPDPTPVGPGSVESLSGTITVFAAASLTDAFKDVGAEFKKANPKVEITFQFGGSPALRTQLEQGARADVYASADLPQMTMALQNGVVQNAGQVFVKNSLVIITPKDNPGRVSDAIDLKKSGLKLVLAAPEVPVGSYARQSLGLMEKDSTFGAGFSDAVLKNLVSNESNVRQVVAKVELGEVDAGIVYGTDVTQSIAPKLAVIQIPTHFNVNAEYPIALTKSPANPKTAQAFIDFVLNKPGQDVLKKYGFQSVTS
jgi:molybdate transport system substrate-binding protein